MIYDAMNVHDLIREYALAYDNGGTACGPEWADRLGEIESALRKAVIREASVGTAIISVVQNRRRIHASTLKGLPDGNYDLVPKESEMDNTTEKEYEDMRRNGGPEVKS